MQLLRKLDKFIENIDSNPNSDKTRVINQIFPIIVCLVLFAAFVALSHFFIVFLINPSITEPIQLILRSFDFIVGFFLYFVTAVDYALIVGRMQNVNPGLRVRFIMNVFTCVGCFVGVSVVLFLWGYAKEISWLILPLLVFAGSVMIKLAYEGKEYFDEHSRINKYFSRFTTVLLEVLYYPTRLFTFWMPELGSPNVKKMSFKSLASWSFFLPFIIGLDDLVGYMGAMTIYNVFSLLIGIYFADILIDILIFTSPSLTKKIVVSPLLSILAAYAFIYLAYKSFSEAAILMHEKFHIGLTTGLTGFFIFLGLVVLADMLAPVYNKTKPTQSH